jgi:hypothetical protein
MLFFWMSKKDGKLWMKPKILKKYGRSKMEILIYFR